MSACTTFACRFCRPIVPTRWMGQSSTRIVQAKKPTPKPPHKEPLNRLCANKRMYVCVHARTVTLPNPITVPKNRKPRQKEQKMR
ncbi:unnamed protein product [Periconia digitata]|uniref:Uncharacterized protein n=1 Tax=Periconia digitata TaxID=1303443 RepID=A0A9W4U6J8_9PLEO|nr:unnamed protein product [Periconia digitata]